MTRHESWERPDWPLCGRCRHEVPRLYEKGFCLVCHKQLERGQLDSKAEASFKSTTQRAVVNEEVAAR